MKKIIMAIVAALLFAAPWSAFADESPLKLAAGAKADAVMHNDEGIAHYGQGHFDVALQHFQGAAKAENSGEIHFNQAIALDKMGKHGDASMHFKEAQKMAKGNKAILESKVLNAHVK